MGTRGMFVQLRGTNTPFVSQVGMMLVPASNLLHAIMLGIENRAVICWLQKGVKLTYFAIVHLVCGVGREAKSDGIADKCHLPCCPN